MKPKKTNEMYPFMLVVIAILFFSIAQAQDIYPSAIIQIEKADPEKMKKLMVKEFYNHENELNENFRHKNRETADGSLSAKNNSASNSVSMVIGAPAPKKPGICPPLVQTNFEGNPLTPFYLPPVGYYASECSIAISNAGKIVSISNGWIRYYHEDGTQVFSDSLYHFGNSLIDVHVLYDPKNDRFVFISQYGYTNFVSSFQVAGVAVAFSKSNDPVDGWNFYFLPDISFNDNSVGDYPLLGISDNEVFITDIRTNKSGNYNITHSSIVQIDKNAGYAGAASISSQIYKVRLSSSTKGAISPAPGGSSTYGPNMYFIMSYENGNPNDKYFVFEITNTIASGQAVLKTYGPVHSNITYASAGACYQPGGIELFDLNAMDNTYLQNAFYENGLLQFGQNTNVNGKAGVILARITGLPNNLSCTAKTVSDPNVYLQFPRIAYAGNSSSDNSAIVGIQYTAENTFPGLFAVYVNSNFEISPLTTVKAGTDTINGLWGDYSGICRRYNHPGQVWFEGQYGSDAFPNINWIAKLNSPANCKEQTIVSNNIQTRKLNPGLKINPNPSSNSTSISFTIYEKQNVSVKIFDANGRMIKVLATGKFDKGQYEFKWNTSEISAGIYFLHFGAGTYLDTKEISVIK